MVTKIKFPIYWSEAAKISWLQRYILVHSYLYYETGNTIISDYTYDGYSGLLVEYINKYPKAFKASEYYKAFREFDGTTGFDLYYKLNSEQQKRIGEVANWIIQKQGK